MTRAGSVLVASIVLGLVAAACSGSDAAAPATSAPTTSAAPTTTSTTTTTEATTTTIDPAAELAAQVEADFLEADRLGREASMDPFDAEKEAAALDRRLGVIADNFAAKLADYRAKNYAIRTNPATPASMTVEVPAKLVVEGGDVANLQVCEVDSWIVVEVGAGPNATDAIVNPDIAAYRSEIFVRNVGGIWKVEGGNEIGTWEGASKCPAS